MDIQPMKVSAVLFDLDGTLLNTIEDLTDSMNAALHELGYPGHSVAACKTLVGEGIEHFVRCALPSGEAENEGKIARTISLMRSEYRKRWSHKTRPYEGIPALLEDLAARGLKLAVLSNKADDFTRMMVAHYFPRPEFAAIVGARADRPRKPDPATALEVAAALGVAPAETIFLGDTKTDMETASGAGMVPVGALWGFRSAEELLANGARYLLSRPAELLSFIA
jgi:phosphoglycolate phosphatase